MILPDINFLIYAHRADSPFHEQALNFFKKIVSSPAPFALSSFASGGFIRIVTNHRIFQDPTPLSQAISFVESLLALENCRLVEPGERHWKIFRSFLEEAGATGNLVSDAYLAAIAVEHGCELLTNDADFRKFSGLKIEHLAVSPPLTDVQAERFWNEVSSGSTKKL